VRGEFFYCYRFYQLGSIFMLSNLIFNFSCEHLLKKSFDICMQCFRDRKFLVQTVMSVDSSGKPIQKWLSDIHHTGNTKFDVPSTSCGCHAGPCSSVECQLPHLSDQRMKYRCKKCSCNCHKRFTMRSRFYYDDDLGKMLSHCETIVGDDNVFYAKETESRLDGVRMINSNDPNCDQRTKVLMDSQMNDILETLACPAVLDNSTCDSLVPDDTEPNENSKRKHKSVASVQSISAMPITLPIQSEEVPGAVTKVVLPSTLSDHSDHAEEVTGAVTNGGMCYEDVETNFKRLRKF
jgi:hypothetical protein